MAFPIFTFTKITLNIGLGKHEADYPTDPDAEMAFIDGHADTIDTITQDYLHTLLAALRAEGYAVEVED